jgi:hypothetical protein
MRIVVGKNVRCTGEPAGPHPITCFHSDLWISSDIADIGRTFAVLCHDPELPPHETTANGSTSSLSALPTHSLQQSISGWCNAQSEKKLNRRVEKILLDEMDNFPFHDRIRDQSNRLSTLDSAIRYYSSTENDKPELSRLRGFQHGRKRPLSRI